MACANGKEFIVTWLIENYSFCGHENGVEIKSPLFRTVCLGGSKWRLHLVPREISDEKEVTQCFLKRYDNNDEIWIDYKIEMIDPAGTILGITEGKNEEFRPLYDSDSTLVVESGKLDVQHWSENTLTVRCRMKNGGPHPQPAIGCEIRTKIGIDSYNFRWEVDLPLVDIVCKEFPISEKTKLKAELSKSGISSNDPIDIKMSKIESESGYPLQRLISCKIFLLNACGKAVKSSKHMHLFKASSDKDVWEFPSFLTSLDLEKHSHEERTKASLQFEFFATNGTQGETPSSFQYSTNADSLLILQLDMRKLFLNKKHTDIELKCKDSKILSAHKSILTARSAVFSKMFDQDMTESRSSVVVVEEDENTMQVFLEYLYTGTVEKMDCNNAKELMMAADKYQVLSLKDKCATYLLNAFTIRDVCEILSFASLIQHQQLKAAALDYIAVHLKEIMKLPEWSTVADNQELVGDILSTVAQKM